MPEYRTDLAIQQPRSEKTKKLKHKAIRYE